MAQQAKKPALTTPLRQIYFGEKAIRIEKNWEEWLKDPKKLEENLKIWFAENAKVMEENLTLQNQMIENKKEMVKQKNSFEAERISWASERTKFQNQVNDANNLRDAMLKQLEDSRDFIKKTYVYLGNYGTNPPLFNLGQLKWLLRKHDKPTIDKDYYTIYDLLAGVKLDKDRKDLEELTDMMRKKVNAITPIKFLEELEEKAKPLFLKMAFPKTWELVWFMQDRIEDLGNILNNFQQKKKPQPLKWWK